uniref:Uncharacterized protein n=1 Tax=Panagrolaimus sp. JU765 TaxID=591449 RepID=A0AC34QA00_9BILA
MFLTLISLFFLAAAEKASEKCYSCASANLLQKWPKTINNKPFYLDGFPLVADDSCDSLRGPIPVVPCPDSVCVKVVLDEPPTARAVCETGPLIVRDCWSRVMSPGNFSLKPPDERPVRLASHLNINDSVGLIHTCDGFLCNYSPKQTLFVPVILFSISL